jgi:hypothetical protein
MKRGFLHWFYLGVQFVMLAVSIPKVAMLFHAYDTEAMGPLFGGIDLRSWLVGLAIDITATITTWAAMAKYEATGKRLSLVAPALIIAVCTGLSVVANYEDAATKAPEQYASVSLFTHPALLINPVLISAPPVLVLLLVTLVPSVLARPRLKTAAEIAAEAAEQEALINAKAQIKRAQANANATILAARLKGLADNVGTVAKRAGLAKETPAEVPDLPDVPEASAAPSFDPGASGILPIVTPAKMNKKLWDALPLKERVLQSGIISPQETAEVLGVKLTRGRELVGEAKTKETPVVPGRTGAAYQALIDSLYAKHTPDGLTHAQKLEKALGLRRRTRQLHVVEPEPGLLEASSSDDDGDDAA